MAEEWNISLAKKQFEALVGEYRVNGEKVLLVKPQTYMNLSGTSVKQIVDFYHIESEDVMVIYDDIDIALGKIRVRKSGSPGTHNGMRNITQLLSTEAFPRIRIGTDKPKFDMNLADYVLMPFTKEEAEKVEEAIELAADAAMKWISSDIKAVMNEFNGK